MRRPVRRLLWSALAVVAGAAILAVVVVLPAERGVDPTGLGRVIGLTEMGEIKRDIAAELVAESTFFAESRRADSTQAAAEAAALRALAAGAVPRRTDTTTIMVPPRSTRALRLQMTANAWTVFSWTADHALDDDVRGDSVLAPNSMYHRYRGGAGRTADSGAVVAKFDGLHGWVWTNRFDSAATIRLVTRGDYSDIVIADR